MGLNGYNLQQQQTRASLFQEVEALLVERGGVGFAHDELYDAFGARVSLGTWRRYMTCLRQEKRVLAPPRLGRVWHPESAPEPTFQMSFRQEFVLWISMGNSKWPSSWPKNRYILAQALGYRRREVLDAAEDRWLRWIRKELPPGARKFQ